jgi:FixJ family two-component response regulator
MTPSEGEAEKMVCLVDDDQSFLNSMRRLLASEGIEAHAFDKPEEFLIHAAANPVAVVVTDIRMKGVTGLEILARMCAISPRPRVIVVTGRDDLAARTTAMQIGPVAFLVKPFGDAAFLAAVHDALAQAAG